MRSSLDQYCINVSDLARSERFYTEALGLSVTHRIEIPGVSEVVLAGASGNRIQLARHHEQSGPIEHGNAHLLSSSLTISSSMEGFAV